MRIGLPVISARDTFWKPMSNMAPSPPTATTGGHSRNSSSEKFRQLKYVKKASCVFGSYWSSISSSAMRRALNPSAILTMCPSKMPMATEELSWNKWLVHGNG